MPYTDELEAMLDYERKLRHRIALRIAEEAGAPTSAVLSEGDVLAADEAISAWAAIGEDDHDLRAFRPIGPLQELLAEHHDLVDRIVDLRDRRLS